MDNNNKIKKLNLIMYLVIQMIKFEKLELFLYIYTKLL